MNYNLYNVLLINFFLQAIKQQYYFSVIINKNETFLHKYVNPLTLNHLEFFQEMPILSTVNWFATVTLNTFRTQTTKTIHFKTINGKHVFLLLIILFN